MPVGQGARRGMADYRLLNPRHIALLLYRRSVFGERRRAVVATCKTTQTHGEPRYSWHSRQNLGAKGPLHIHQGDGAIVQA